MGNEIVSRAVNQFLESIKDKEPRAEVHTNLADVPQFLFDAPLIEISVFNLLLNGYEAMPAGGALPCLIDWGTRGTPAPDMPDLGLSLKSLDVETPEPDAVRASLDAIGMADKPDIRSGAAVKLIAAIDTPHGVRLLT